MANADIIEQTLLEIRHPGAVGILRPLVRDGGGVFYSPLDDRGVIRGAHSPQCPIEQTRQHREEIGEFAVLYGRPEPEGGFTVDAETVPELLSLTEHIVLRLRRDGPMTVRRMADLLERETCTVKGQITRLKNKGVLDLDEADRVSLPARSNRA